MFGRTCYATSATDLVHTGTVAQLLGHALLDSTRIYTLPTDGTLDAAIARLIVGRRPRKIDC